MSRTKHKHMPDISELANLYLQLGRMEEAGVSHAQAFNILIETGSPLSASLSSA